MLKGIIKMEVVLSLCLLSSLSFAKDQFFGVNLVFIGTYDKYLTAVTNIKENPDGGVLYTIDRKYADDSITAFASVGRDVIVFTIKNETKFPLKMNYLADTYSLLEKDDTIYRLEVPQDSIPNYPRTLNPKNSVLITTRGFSGNIDDIQYLSISIGHFGKVASLILNKIEPNATINDLLKTDLNKK